MKQIQKLSATALMMLVLTGSAMAGNLGSDRMTAGNLGSDVAIAGNLGSDSTARGNLGSDRATGGNLGSDVRAYVMYMFYALGIL